MPKVKHKPTVCIKIKTLGIKISRRAEKYSILHNTKILFLIFILEIDALNNYKHAGKCTFLQIFVSLDRSMYLLR